MCRVCRVLVWSLIWSSPENGLLLVLSSWEPVPRLWIGCLGRGRYREESSTDAAHQRWLSGGILGQTGKDKVGCMSKILTRI